MHSGNCSRWALVMNLNPMSRVEERWNGLGTVFAIVGLTIMEVAALHYGVNGTVFTLVVAAVAGLGGYSIRRRIKED